MIRIEFWNGQISKKKKYNKYSGLVYTSHNPCLWSNISKDKPWRNVYSKAVEYIENWKLNKINDTELLHSLRYVAYGYSLDGNDKRSFDNVEVIWPGNLTIGHRPKLVYKNDLTNEEFTLNFSFANISDNNPTNHHWKIKMEDVSEFYWDL